LLLLFLLLLLLLWLCVCHHHGRQNSGSPTPCRRCVHIRVRTWNMCARGYALGAVETARSGGVVGLGLGWGLKRRSGALHREYGAMSLLSFLFRILLDGFCHSVSTSYTISRVRRRDSRRRLLDGLPSVFFFLQSISTTGLGSSSRELPLTECGPMLSASGVEPHSGNRGEGLRDFMCSRERKSVCVCVSERRISR